MEDFINGLFVEYPIPKTASIWWGDGVNTQPVEDIQVLVKTVVRELASDVLMTQHIQATGIATQLPQDTITVLSAKLYAGFMFQGNRLVKATFDVATKICYLRYYPAVISYRRKFREEDIPILQGDTLIFVKCYALWKMAEKELSVLRSVNMNVDHGAIDLSVLTNFSDKMREKYEKLKEEILIYSTVN